MGSGPKAIMYGSLATFIMLFAQSNWWIVDLGRLLVVCFLTVLALVHFMVWLIGD